MNLVGDREVLPDLGKRAEVDRADFGRDRQNAELVEHGLDGHDLLQEASRSWSRERTTANLEVSEDVEVVSVAELGGDGGATVRLVAGELLHAVIRLPNWRDHTEVVGAGLERRDHGLERS